MSNWAYMVMTALAWNLKAWWALLLPERRAAGRSEHRSEKQWVLRMEFKTFVNAFVRLPCQIVRTGRRLVYRLLAWNPYQRDLLPAADGAAVLTIATMKSESGCSDPCCPKRDPRQECAE